MYYRHPAAAITTTSNGTERSTAPQLLLLLRQSVERRRALISIQIPRNFPTTTTVESSPRRLYPEFLGSLQILPGSTFLLLSPNILLLAHAHCTLWIRKYRFYVYAARAYTLRFVPARSLALSLALSPSSSGPEFAATSALVQLNILRTGAASHSIPSEIRFRIVPLRQQSLSPCIHILKRSVI